MSGSSLSAKGTWTALVTLTGQAGDSLSGSWSDGGGGAECAIGTGGSSCTVELPDIRKKTSSVTFTDVALGSLVVGKP